MSYSNPLSPSAPEVFHESGQLEPASHLYEGLEVQPAHYGSPALPADIYAKIQAEEEQPLRGVPRRVSSMKATTFWIIICVICIIVIGAAVGGAVGGTFAARRNNTAAAVNDAASNPSSTAPTSNSVSTSSSAGPTSTSSAASTTSTVSSAAATSSPAFKATTDCPSSNLTTYKSEYLSGGSGSPPDGALLTFQKFCGFSGAGLNNIFESYVATFDDCIETCASHNFWVANSTCYAATFTPSGTRPGNCWAQSLDTPTSDGGLVYSGNLDDNIAIVAPSK